MDINMKIDSEKVRNLRNKRGWSQEQLSASSGLSLRTIQRVEAEGNISRESKVCLAATFDINLSELDFVGALKTNTDSVVKYKPNKIVISVGLLSFLISVVGYLFFTEPSYIFLIANMFVLSTIMHSLLNWYFSESTKNQSVLKRSVRVFFIYVFCYSAFSLIGGQSTNTLFNGLLSGFVFCIIYFLIDLKLSTGKSSNSIVKQA
jgi:transcriptional regulator with XRE-family HTH domain